MVWKQSLNKFLHIGVCLGTFALEALSYHIKKLGDPVGETPRREREIPTQTLAVLFQASHPARYASWTF